MKTDKLLATALCGAMIAAGLMAPAPAGAVPLMPEIATLSQPFETIREPDTRAYKKCRRKYRYMRQKGRNRSGIYYWQAVDSCVRGA